MYVRYDMAQSSNLIAGRLCPKVVDVRESRQCVRGKRREGREGLFFLEEYFCVQTWLTSCLKFLRGGGEEP